MLIVDDDEQHLKLTALVLRDAGYDVVTRSQVIGTSFAVASEQPDMVLCDLHMPLITGDRLVPLIRRTVTNPLLIILYSAVDERVLEQRAADCGADGSIPKGLEPERFLQRFELCFKRAIALRHLSEVRGD